MGNSIQRLSPGKHRSIGGAVIVGVVAIVASMFIYTSYLSPSAKEWRGLQSVWNGVPSVLNAGMYSAAYSNGGKSIGNTNSIRTAEDTNSAAYRILVDFLRSLTPQQIGIIEHKPLPFGQLSSEQQKHLLQMTDLYGAKILKNGRQESRVYIVPRNSNAKGEFKFCWAMPAYDTTPTSDKFGIFIVFSSNGPMAAKSFPPRDVMQVTVK